MLVCNIIVWPGAIPPTSVCGLDSRPHTEVGKMAPGQTRCAKWIHFAEIPNNYYLMVKIDAFLKLVVALTEIQNVKNQKKQNDIAHKKIEIIDP